MATNKVFYLFILFILSSAVFVQAAEDRDIIIQKEMNCVDEHLQQKDGISWNDICDIPDYSPQDHLTAINQQMDQVEKKFTSPYSQTPKKPNFDTEVASEVSHIRYHEIGLIKETGNMYGINGIFTYHPPPGDDFNTEIANVYRLEGRFSYGEVNYRGQTVNLNTGATTPLSINGISDYMVEIRPILGKEYYVNNQSTRLTPYIGGGYRSLFDAGGDRGSYNRHIQYLYIPTGADIMTKLMDGWSIGANMEYDIFIRGFVTSYLGEVGLGDASNTQTSGYGVRGSIKLIKNCNRFNFILEPYFRYWHIQNSNFTNSAPFNAGGTQYYIPDLYEPNNTSLELGAKAGIEF